MREASGVHQSGEDMELIWGGAAIAAVIQRDLDETYYLLSKK